MLSALSVGLLYARMNNMHIYRRSPKSLRRLVFSYSIETEFSIQTSAFRFINVAPGATQLISAHLIQNKNNEDVIYVGKAHVRRKDRLKIVVVEFWHLFRNRIYQEFIHDLMGRQTPIATEHVFLPNIHLGSNGDHQTRTCSAPFHLDLQHSRVPPKHPQQVHWLLFQRLSPPEHISGSFQTNDQVPKVVI